MTSVIVKEREAGHRSTIVSVREYWKGRLLRLDTGVRQRPGLGLCLPQLEVCGLLYSFRAFHDNIIRGCGR